MASAHSALIKFILDASRKLPFVGRCHLRKLQSGKVKVGNRYIDLGEAGWPDLIGFNRVGHFVGIEIKVGRDFLRKEQLEFKAKLSTSDFAQWHLVTSEAEAIAALEKICS